MVVSSLLHVGMRESVESIMTMNLILSDTKTENPEGDVGLGRGMMFGQSLTSISTERCKIVGNEGCKLWKLQIWE